MPRSHREPPPRDPAAGGTQPLVLRYLVVNGGDCTLLTLLRQVKNWELNDDPFAGGAFALFDPGQQTLLHDEIVKPEGRIHFAGEHASLYHAWIQGAFESGLRAAIAIHQAP